MKRTQTLEELMKLEALVKARKTIKNLQEQISARLLDISAAVEDLRIHMPDRQIVDFLHAACEMDPAEASAHIRASRTLMDARDVLKDARAGFPLLKALAAADAESREEALYRIGGGATLGARDVAAIRSVFRKRRMSWPELRAEAGVSAAKAAVRRRVAEGLKEVDREVGDIMKTIDIHDARLLDTSNGVALRLQAAATSILPRFEDVYGKPAEGEEASAEKRSTHAAFRALVQIAKGDFKSVTDIYSGAAKNTFYHWIDRADPFGTLVHSLQGVTRSRPSTHFAKPKPREVYTRLPGVRHSVVELCAGAGGMSLGLERAGFEPAALYEFDADAAATLRLNRPRWPVFQTDIKTVDFRPYREQKIDLLVGGLPCQPYSSEGYGRGKKDPRDLLPQGARAVEEILPKAFVFENVLGLLHARHSDHLGAFIKRLRRAGYSCQIIRMEAEDYGVPQERSRILIVGMRGDLMGAFRAPPSFPEWRLNLGDAIGDLMAENGWRGAAAWTEARRNTIVVKNGVEFKGQLASTVVGRKGGSRDKERERWAKKGIDITNVADRAPTQAEADAAGPDFLPCLTLRMRARLQAFPDNWFFVGGKGSAARQIGNAVPPPIGMAIGLAVSAALLGQDFDYPSLLHPQAIVEAEIKRKRSLSIDTVPPLEPVIENGNSSKSLASKISAQGQLL